MKVDWILLSEQAEIEQIGDVWGARWRTYAVLGVTREKALQNLATVLEWSLRGVEEITTEAV